MGFNPLNRVYKCPFTVNIFKQDRYGNFLGMQKVHTYVRGEEDATYNVNGQRFCPRGYRVDPRSISFVSGIIGVYMGRPFLSSNTADFIYVKGVAPSSNSRPDSSFSSGASFTASSSSVAQPAHRSSSVQPKAPKVVTMAVDYVDVSTKQTVQHGSVKGRSGQSVDVTDHLKLKSGYEFVPGQTLVTVLKPSRTSMSIDVKPIPQPVTVTVEYQNARNGQTIKSGQIKGYAGHQVSIGDRLHLPNHYEFLPDQKLRIPLSSGRSHLTFKVKPVREVHHNYLTIDILQRNPRGEWIHEQPQFKPLHGYVGDHRHVDAKEFQPKGYHLDPKSKPTVDVEITHSGLSLPKVTWRYVSNQVKKGTLNVQYLNQHGANVGSGKVSVPVGSSVDVTDNVKIPDGYQYRSGGRQQTVQSGTHDVTLKLLGNAVNTRQGRVRYTVIKSDQSGHVLSQKKAVAQATGRIGDDFKIQPVKRAPEGFRVAGDPNVTGRLTPQGAKVRRGMITLMPLPAQPITVKYVDTRDPQRVLSSHQVTGSYHQSIDVTKQVAVPRGYQLVGGQQATYVIGIHPQEVTLKLQRIVKPKPQPQPRPQSQNEPQLEKTGAKVQPQRKSQRQPEEQRPNVRTGADQVPKQFARPQSSQPVQSSQVHPQPHSAVSHSASSASNVNGTHLSHQVSQKYDKLVIKQAFLGHYYDLVYHTHHYYGVGPLAEQGMKMADSCIKGIDDARTQQPFDRTGTPGYVLGYTTFDKIRRKHFANAAKPISLFRASLMALNTFLVNP